MAEQHGEGKYIKCSKCKCKYINDDEHIKADFGYNRLNERYKTCVTCRNKAQAKVEQKMSARVGDDQQCCTRCCNVRHVKEYGEYVDLVYLDGTKHWTPYKTCSSCRNRDKRRVF